MADSDFSVQTVSAVILGLTLLSLVAWVYFSQSASHAYPENEANAFLKRCNKALAPVIGADRVPLMRKGITVAVGQGVLGRNASEFEYGLITALEGGAIDTSEDVYYKIVVNSRPSDYYALFTPKDLRSFGYGQSSFAGGTGADGAGEKGKAFWTRVFSSGDADACFTEPFSNSGAVKLCVWTECAAQVCVHSFFNCGGTRVDWLLESTEELKQTALGVNEKVKAAFANAC